MNVYDYIDLFAVAIRDNAAVLNFCKTNFDNGLLIQIDDDAEDILDSKAAPYCLLHSMTGSDDSPVQEQSSILLRMEIGTVPSGEPPYSTDTTDRTKLANGLRKYGQGEKAVDLLYLCLTAVREKPLDACDLMQASTVEADGILFFPLQIAASVVQISRAKDLETF